MSTYYPTNSFAFFIYQQFRRIVKIQHKIHSVSGPKLWPNTKPRSNKQQQTNRPSLDYEVKPIFTLSVTIIETNILHPNYSPISQNNLGSFLSVIIIIIISAIGNTSLESQARDRMYANLFNYTFRWVRDIALRNRIKKFWVSGRFDISIIGGLIKRLICMMGTGFNCGPFWFVYLHVKTNL